MSIALVNPFWYTPPPSFITRTYYDAGYTTAPTVITTTQTTHKTISTTETAGDEYAFFYQAILDHSGTTLDAIAILNESPTERQRFNLEAQDATDQFSIGGAYAYAGGTNRTITLDSDEEDAATNEIENYALCALKLVANDGFGHSAAQSDSTSTTYATKTSVSVPGTSSGGANGIIIASASILQSAAAVAKVRVFNQLATLTGSEISGTFYAQDTTNWTPYWFFQRYVAPSATRTLSIDFGRVGATGTASIRQASIVFLREDEFENVYYEEQLTTQTTTSTTAWGGVALGYTFTVANPTHKHLLLGYAWHGSSSTTRSSNIRLFNTTDSVDYSGASIREANISTERYPVFVAQIVTFGSSSQTIQWQHYISGGTGTSTVDDCGVAIFDLGTSV